MLLGVWCCLEWFGVDFSTILGDFRRFWVILGHFGPFRLKCIRPKVGLAMVVLREGGPLFFWASFLGAT